MFALTGAHLTETHDGFKGTAGRHHGAVCAQPGLISFECWESLGVAQTSWAPKGGEGLPKAVGDPSWAPKGGGCPHLGLPKAVGVPGKGAGLLAPRQQLILQLHCGGNAIGPAQSCEIPRVWHTGPARGAQLARRDTMGGAGLAAEPFYQIRLQTTTGLNSCDKLLSALIS